MPVIRKNVRNNFKILEVSKNSRKFILVEVKKCQKLTCQSTKISKNRLKKAQRIENLENVRIQNSDFLSDIWVYLHQGTF